MDYEKFMFPMLLHGNLKNGLLGVYVILGWICAKSIFLGSKDFCFRDRWKIEKEKKKKKEFFNCFEAAIHMRHSGLGR